MKTKKQRNKKKKKRNKPKKRGGSYSLSDFILSFTSFFLLFPLTRIDLTYMQHRLESVTEDNGWPKEPPLHDFSYNIFFLSFLFLPPFYLSISLRDEGLSAIT